MLLDRVRFLFTDYIDFLIYRVIYFEKCILEFVEFKSKILKIPGVQKKVYPNKTLAMFRCTCEMTKNYMWVVTTMANPKNTSSGSYDVEQRGKTFYIEAYISSKSYRTTRSLYLKKFGLVRRKADEAPSKTLICKCK